MPPAGGRTASLRHPHRRPGVLHLAAVPFPPDSNAKRGQSLSRPFFVDVGGVFPDLVRGREDFRSFPHSSLLVLPLRYTCDPVCPSICDRMNEHLAGFVVDRKGYDGFSPGRDRPQTGCYFVTDGSHVRGLCQARDGPFNLGQRPISRHRPRIIEDPLDDDPKITCHQRVETDAVPHVFGSVPIVARAVEKT